MLLKPADVLVDEDRVAVRIDDDEAAGAGARLVDFGDEADILRLQLPL